MTTIELDQRSAAAMLGCSVTTVSKYSNFPEHSPKRIPRNPVTGKYPVLGLVWWSLKNSVPSADLKTCAQEVIASLAPSIVPAEKQPRVA